MSSCQWCSSMKTAEFETNCHLFRILTHGIMCVARFKWFACLIRYLIGCFVVYRAHFSKISLELVTGFVGSMAGEHCSNDRRSLTISVAVLGVTLSIVFLAFFAFSEINNDPDISSIQFAAFVSEKIQFLGTKSFVTDN